MPCPLAACAHPCVDALLSAKRPTRARRRRLTARDASRSPTLPFSALRSRLGLQTALWSSSTSPRSRADRRNRKRGKMEPRQHPKQSTARSSPSRSASSCWSAPAAPCKVYASIGSPTTSRFSSQLRMLATSWRSTWRAAARCSLTSRSTHPLPAPRLSSPGRSRATGPKQAARL